MLYIRSSHTKLYLYYTSRDEGGFNQNHWGFVAAWGGFIHNFWWRHLRSNQITPILSIIFIVLSISGYIFHLFLLCKQVLQIHKKVDVVILFRKLFLVKLKNKHVYIVKMIFFISAFEQTSYTRIKRKLSKFK